MNAATNNVVGLHNRSVNEDIETHLNSFESNFTRTTYRNSLSKFFMWYKGKDLTTLKAEDLIIRNADILRYRNFLTELKDEDGERLYMNTTINNHIAAIQSLYSFFEKNDYDIKAIVTHIKPLSDDSKRCGTLYPHEAEQMAIVVKGTKKGVEKSALIQMAYITSFRKSSLLNIEWTDIVYDGLHSYYTVRIVGKGGIKHVVPIEPDLYKYLLKIKEQPYYAKYKDNKIFHLDKKTIQNMMVFLREQLNITKERNIVFHSFRNVASSFGTLEEAKLHYNHSSYDVTERYRHKDNDLSNSLSLRIGNKIDDSVFGELTKEELIMIIQNQHEGVIAQMKRDAKKIIDDKEN
ncbi:tyrosine-type recombinase/integrase [Paenibacillus polymyxa]|uniref:tyrosine-type recombinase/integrase n=1 Tax=Paenibacillus polymyxa TaxID=1406 RepID=UPI00287FCC5B|nr:tyrosine-type recombinase/integrase [Paenibacillus polymyxa]